MIFSVVPITIPPLSKTPDGGISIFDSIVLAFEIDVSDALQIPILTGAEALVLRLVTAIKALVTVVDGTVYTVVVLIPEITCRDRVPDAMIVSCVNLFSSKY